MTPDGPALLSLKAPDPVSCETESIAGPSTSSLEDHTMRVLLMLLAVAAMAVIPAAAAQQAKSPAPASKSSRASKAAPAPTSPINLNTATQAQLESLPGVGPKAAQRVIEYRKQNGNFKKVEDLMNVKGFGEKTFLKLKPMLTVSEKAGAN
jgi:comEA protein